MTTAPASDARTGLSMTGSTCSSRYCRCLRHPPVQPSATGSPRGSDARGLSAVRNHRSDAGTRLAVKSCMGTTKPIEGQRTKDLVAGVLGDVKDLAVGHLERM